MKKPKVQQGFVAYVAGAWVGRERQKHASSLFYSCRRAVWGLTQLSLRLLVFSLEIGEVSNVTGLAWSPSWTLTCSRRVFPIMQHPNRQDNEGVPWPKFCILGKGEQISLPRQLSQSPEGSTQVCAKPTCTDENILQPDGLSHPTVAATWSVCSKHVCCVRGRGHSSSTPVKMHKTERRQIHHLLPMIWFPMTSCSKYKRQNTNSLLLMRGKEWKKWQHLSVNAYWIFADG